jgi:hypothetical protein
VYFEHGRTGGNRMNQQQTRSINRLQFAANDSIHSVMLKNNFRLASCSRSLAALIVLFGYGAGSPTLFDKKHLTQTRPGRSYACQTLGGPSRCRLAGAADRRAAETRAGFDADSLKLEPIGCCIICACAPA